MKWTTAGAAALTLLVAACGYTQEERVTGGAAAGAATGAGIGALGGPAGALAGAAIGGVAGGVTGATTSPSDLNLGRPPWTNPEAELPFDDRRPVAARGSAVRGSGSADVRRAQAELNRRGFNAGPADGIWGPQTASAVSEFQRRNNLAASGRLDAATMQALDIRPSGAVAGRPARDRDRAFMGGGAVIDPATGAPVPMGGAVGGGGMAVPDTRSTGPGGTSNVGSGNQPATRGTTGAPSP